jgi:Methyltransferase domain
MDWKRWHEQYETPDSPLSARLRTVQDRIGEVLDAAPSGPLSVLSLCAGEGRDLLTVLPAHPRRADVRARLIEFDPELAGVAARSARAAGLAGVEVVIGDAGLTEHVRGVAPADLVLLCGVFGNLTDDDIKATVEHCDQLCRPGGSVIWTRHRKDPDRVPMICYWFAARGFELRWLTEPSVPQGVGVHRFTGRSRPLAQDARMFTFVGSDALPG